jgi:hypothetical protein
MRSGPDQRSRGRFNPNRPSQQQPRGPQPNQTFNSNGRDERIRGTAFQIYQRYLTLAQEAARSDDRVATENYYQHAEHYFRVNNESRDRNSAGPSVPIGQAAAQTGFVADPRETLMDQAQPRMDDD